MPSLSLRFLPITSLLVVAALAASCSGDSEDATTSVNSPDVTTTTSSVPDTTTTSVVPAEVLVAFDGTSCSVSGGPLEPGFAQTVSVLNTSPNQAIGLIIELSSSYLLGDLAADIDAGVYEPDSAYQPRENQVNVTMASDATDATVQPFNARTGSWAVVCLDVTVQESRAFLASDVFEVL